jgi:hypothetical protein
MTQEEIASLETELAGLPPGSIVRRLIRGAERFYHQWREDGTTRSRYLKPGEVEALRAKIARRKEIARLLAQSPRRAATPRSPSFRTNVAVGENLVRLARGVEKFKTRDMFHDMMKYLRSDSFDRVFVVCGLRRTGKTTMLRQAVLALGEKERAKAAYAKMTERDSMALLRIDLETLHESGYKYIFIDEVTLMEDFIDTAGVLSDIFAGMGMKIVLSGTDSLGFWFAERDELYDRAFTLHTTFIPFREHARLLGTDDVDTYINFGGTLRAGELLFAHADAKNDAASFRDDETTRFYIDTAIARNIQRSLRCVDGGRHFRLLIDLYEAGELTNAVNRIIEDMNHRFVLQTLTREFESSDLKLAARNLARTMDSGRRTDAILKADIRRVTARLMEILDIRHAEDLKIGLTDACTTQIREYLQALDLIVPCSIEFDGATGEHSERVLFSQPGMRHAQAQALVFALMDDPSFASVSARERKIVADAILDEVKGRMLEDIVLLETIKARGDGNTSAFKLQFAAGEFDMVVADRNRATCEIYEVKHSTVADDRQLRHLVDPEKLAATERRYGTILSRTVIYRGGGFVHSSGIAYRNAAEYLKSL